MRGEHERTEAERPCPRCGSADLVFELRDPAPVPGGGVPPRHTFGEWRVCPTCGHEWPVERPRELLGPALSEYVEQRIAETRAEVASTNGELGDDVPDPDTDPTTPEEEL